MTAEEATRLLALLQSEDDDVPEIDQAALIRAYLCAIRAAGTDPLL